MSYKVAVIGAGNLGSILAVKFSRENDVFLYTNMSSDLPKYHKDMKVYSEDDDLYYSGDIKLITDDLSLAVKDAEYIFVTFPSFLFGNFSKELIPLLKKGQHLVFIPGCGGAEFYFKDALKKGVTITGLQRVHSVARIIEMGVLTKESGKKKLLKVASIPSSFNEEACKAINSLYDIEVMPLDNYLNITFVNSNPILHTSRLYSIFKDYPEKREYESLPLFYEEWDIESANLLSDMDDELTSMFKVTEKYGLPVNDIVPIVKYYDGTCPKEMMDKIKSIQSFKGLSTPSIKNDNGTYSPDLASRYFTADFPYGLDILVSFAKILKVNHPKMDMVSNWYHRISGNNNRFRIEDFGITTIEELMSLYK